MKRRKSVEILHGKLWEMRRRGVKKKRGEDEACVCVCVCVCVSEYS